MGQYPLEQSSLSRAVGDTKRSVHNLPFFCGVEVIATLMGGFVGSVITPDQAGALMSAGYPAVGALIGVIVGFTIIFAVNLLASPYRQRNEARAALLEKPEPKPISNKDALIRAISNFKECALVKFTQQQVRKECSCNVPDYECPIMMDGRLSDFNQAYEVLAAERLVAGEKANNIVSPLVRFVLTQIMEQDNDESSSVTKLKSDEFLSELGKIVEKTIRGINTLNSLILDKVNYQTE